MKVVILAGGFGTRLAEETHVIPKPMVHIGPKPILWHIMKLYAHFGLNEFVICLGYKGQIIKDYFANYAVQNADFTINLKTRDIHIHQDCQEDWQVTLVDTGLDVMTGGRLLAVRKYLGDEPFCLTYGDGVADIDIQKLIDFHTGHHKIATVTAVQPPGRFGAMILDNTGTVTTFQEKPKGDHQWINGGFFVLNPQIFDYLDGPQCIFEQDPLKRLTQDQQLAAYRHHGFWQPMDTLRDKTHLENRVRSQDAPWQLWQR